MPQEKANSNIFAIIIMILLFGMISFVTNLASPMGDVLKYHFESQSIKISNWMGTLGVFANFIAYAVTGIPASILLQKKGYKTTSLRAVALGFAGISLQILSGLIPGIAAFGVYLTGAFVAGFSMCLLNTVVNPMLRNLCGNDYRSFRLTQTGGAFSSLCGTAVIIAVGFVAGDIAKVHISSVFPVMFIALDVFVLAFLVIAFSSIPEKQQLTETVIPKKDKYRLLSFRRFILGAIAIFIYVGIEIGIPNVLQKFLQNPDLNVLNVSGEQAATAAGFITGTYWFLMLIGRSLRTKISTGAMLSITSGIGLALVIGAICAGNGNPVDFPVLQKSAEGTLSFVTVKAPLSVAFLVLCGLCTSVMWGDIFSLAISGLGKYTEYGSRFIMVMVCGGGVLPLLQNWIVDLTGGTGYLTSYWVVAAGLLYLLYYAFIGSKNVNKDIHAN